MPTYLRRRPDSATAVQLYRWVPVDAAAHARRRPSATDADRADPGHARVPRLIENS